jgi:PPOX class probable F420-dependent enzyme
MTSFDALGRAKYVLLTTFRRDGQAVATPVWVVPAPSGELVIWTGSDTGKIKRIRNDGQVTLAPCTVRGRVTGDTVQARARLGTPEDAGWAARRVLRKYGLIGLTVFAGSVLRHGRVGGTAVFVSLA